MPTYRPATAPPVATEATNLPCPDAPVLEAYDPAVHAAHRWGPEASDVYGGLAYRCRGYRLPAHLCVPTYAGSPADPCGTEDDPDGSRADRAAAHEHDRQLQRADAVVAEADRLAGYLNLSADR